MAAFLAFELPDRVRDALESAVLPLRRRARGLRFVAPASWHVTVVYLGDGVDHRTLLERELDAAQVDLRLARAERNLTGRLLWVTVEGIPLTFERAARDLAGLGPPERPYLPHVTIASSAGRGRVPVTAPEQIQVPDVSWTATELILYVTRDPVDGPGHREVAVWDLA